jgi:hypothetical protein
MHERVVGLISKIQFNGIGGLRTYISLTPNADVSALGSFGDACIAPQPPPTCIVLAPAGVHGTVPSAAEGGVATANAGVASPRNDVERTEC